MLERGSKKGLEPAHFFPLNGPGLALLYNAKYAASFYCGRWSPGTNLDLAFVSVDSNSRLPDRRVLEKFSRSQHRPSLITPPRLLCRCQACLLSNGTFARPNGVTTLF